MKTNTQKGSAALWIVIVVVIIMVAGGYLYYSMSNRTKNVLQDSGINSISADQPSNTPTSENAPVTPNGNDQYSITLDECNSYFSQSDIERAAGPSDTFTIIAKILSPSGRCHIDIKDTTTDPATSLPHHEWYVDIDKGNVGELQNISSFVCKGSQSLGIGDVSCIPTIDAPYTNQIVFSKADFYVQIQSVTVDAKDSGYVTDVGKVLLGKLSI